jgi:hypothetical protein
MLLNGICPYFTMFPLRFPHALLERHAKKGEAVVDPFVGRGTTLYASRLLGMTACDVDANPVAAAIAEAKLVNTTPGRVVRAASLILKRKPVATDVPEGEFWELAFRGEVLGQLCRLREGLLENCRSDTRKALRAVILGGLHGPLTKSKPSYFSDQCPRTYAPRPVYSVKFWKEWNMMPPAVEVVDLITRRAERYFGKEETVGEGQVFEGDSQEAESFGDFEKEVGWIVTSPPYYEIRTYVPDQWLRRWFVGGSSRVDYSADGQLPHSSEEEFTESLRTVWKNCANVAKRRCRMVIRFGAINDRKVDPREMITDSLNGTGWRLQTCRQAGSASAGRRQADSFVKAKGALEEYDFWAVLVE